MKAGGAAWLRSWRWAFVAVLVAATLAMLWPASGRPSAVAHLDKLGHAGVFALLAVLGRWGRLGTTGRLSAGLLGYGLSIELAQGLFTATRQAEGLDLLADAVGLALGLALAQDRQPPAVHPVKE